MVKFDLPCPHGSTGPIRPLRYPVGARPLGFPPTPDADRRDLSRKDFDAHLQVWRRFLHGFDPDDVEIPPGDR